MQYRLQGGRGYKILYYYLILLKYPAPLIFTKKQWESKGTKRNNFNSGLSRQVFRSQKKDGTVPSSCVTRLSCNDALVYGDKTLVAVEVLVVEKELWQINMFELLSWSNYACSLCVFQF